ncbi:hypothetical protein N399_19105 [Bacillus licheniformis CG-B52]|nr:hypothetical protein MUY_003630 [Bacillus licheniformis WX-02]EQM26294.1 hypothetical protein N399_19105 [Bacillus licheniformis CG-B52]KUL12110.1 hypothetical protein LI17339_07950 [Bacillus licheniformis LMG 17339]
MDVLSGSIITFILAVIDYVRVPETWAAAGQE